MKQQVVYSVTKLGRTENTTMSGIGFITDTDLLIACVSKSGKPYIRVFEDCIKDCHKSSSDDKAFTGMFYEIVTYEERDYEVNYKIWYKYADKQ